MTAVPPIIEIDAYDGDWIKRGQWNLSASNVAELRSWLDSKGMTVEHFKTLQVYKGNVDRMPWLRDL